MNIERSRNAKRNITVGVVNKIFALVLPFVIRTVMIRTLGAEYLGLDSLFTSILQVLNITELGVSSAIVYSMYEPIANDDKKMVCALLNLYKKVYRYIGIIIFVLGIMMVPFLTYFISDSPTVGGGIPDHINLYLIYVIYLINTVIGYLLFAYKTAIPNAIQRLDIVTNVNTITKILLSILQVGVLLILSRMKDGKEIAYYTYILMLPICTIINNLLISFLVNRYYPEYKCYGGVPDSLKRSIKIKISGLLINKICGTTRNALDSICISAFLGLTLTTMYNNYFYVITALISIVSVITTSILAGVGNSIITESREKNYEDFRKMNFLYMWICGWCTITMLSLYQPFMELWVGKKYMFPYGIVVCFCIYFYTLKMGDLRGLYSDAAGLWWENRYRAIIESVMNIILNIVLVQIWGIYGIIIATLSSLFIVNFGFGSQIVFKYYFKNNKLWQYFGDHARYLSVTFIISIITLVTCNVINNFLCQNIWIQGNNNTILILGINGLVTLIVPNIMYILFYRQTKTYRKAIEWIMLRVKIHSDLAKRILLPKENN